jgi:hypothetical protein
MSERRGERLKRGEWKEGGRESGREVVVVNWRR